jgi:hypothetical protein
LSGFGTFAVPPDEVLKVSARNRIVYAVGGTVIRCALVGAVVIALSGCAGDPAPAPLPAGNSPAGPASSGTASSGTGSSGNGAGAPTTSMPPLGPTTPPGDDSKDPLKVYAGWWNAIETALATANPNEPRLARYGADPLLGATLLRLVNLKQSQLVQVVHYTHQQQVVAQSAKRVDIADCVRGPAGTFRDARTGQPRAPDGFRNDMPTHDSIRSVLQLIAGRWYVTAIQAGSKPC